MTPVPADRPVHAGMGGSAMPRLPQRSGRRGPLLPSRLGSSPGALTLL